MGPPIHRFSLAEYLAWEDQQAGRNEFFHREVFAMVGGRRGHGRKLASLREYVLIDPDTRRVELDRPNGDGTATFVDMTDQGVLALMSVDFEIDFTALFKGMDAVPASED